MVPRVEAVAAYRKSSDGRARLGVQQPQDEMRDGSGIFDVAHMGAMGQAHDAAWEVIEEGFGSAGREELVPFAPDEDGLGG